jgi:hypothetical protein
MVEHRPRAIVMGAAAASPMTLANGAAARVRLIVWCDPGEMAERYGADTTVIDWHTRLTCSGRGSRHVDFVVTGTEAGGRHRAIRAAPSTLRSARQEPGWAAGLSAEPPVCPATQRNLAQAGSRSGCSHR